MEMSKVWTLVPPELDEVVGAEALALWSRDTSSELFQMRKGGRAFASPPKSVLGYRLLPGRHVIWARQFPGARVIPWG